MKKSGEWAMMSVVSVTLGIICLYFWNLFKGLELEGTPRPLTPVMLCFGIILFIIATISGAFSLRLRRRGPAKRGVRLKPRKRKKRRKLLKSKKFKVALLAALIVAGVVLFLVIDWDGDGLATLTEFRCGTSAFNSDTDGDGLDDGTEVNTYRTNPLATDTDSDGLTDSIEVNGWSITVENSAQHITSDPLIRDSDGDQLSDQDEYQTHHTNPRSTDTDNDGLDDWSEIYTHKTDPSMTDTDADGLGDRLEVKTYRTDPLVIDTDGDGLSDGLEVNGWSITVEGLPRRVTSNPLSEDSDGDNLSDWDEHDIYGTDPRSSDTDRDGLGDELEIKTYETNPLVADTDGDGLNDGSEVNTYKTNPLSVDTDKDNLGDGLEVRTYGTNPLVPDTDGDGLGDGAEVNIHKTSPTNADTDGDSGRIFTLNDYQEVYVYGTNPLVADTDGDDLIDGMEVELGTDPLGADGGRDPTYSEMLDFLRRDKTDAKAYIEGVYVCYHFAAEVGRNADSEGIRSAYIHIDFPDSAHAIVAFNTVDRGLIFIEPQTDEEMKVEIGKPYWPRYGYWVPDYDDTVVDFKIFW